MSEAYEDAMMELRAIVTSACAQIRKTTGGEPTIMMIDGAAAKKLAERLNPRPVVRGGKPFLLYGIVDGVEVLACR